MSLDDALDGREADSCSFKIIAAVKTLKYAEEFIIVFHIKADPVVFDVKYVLVILGTAARFNMRFVTVLREFDGVVKKI